MEPKSPRSSAVDVVSDNIPVSSPQALTRDQTVPPSSPPLPAVNHDERFREPICPLYTGQGDSPSSPFKDPLRPESSPLWRPLSDEQSSEQFSSEQFEPSLPSPLPAVYNDENLPCPFFAGQFESPSSPFKDPLRPESSPLWAPLKDLPDSDPLSDMSPTTPATPKMVGPHPSHVIVAKPYILEDQVRQFREQSALPDSKEDSYRLQGVAWIDNVRQALMMPIRTYDTACVYYHKFRLLSTEIDFSWIDAAAAALFAASKVEDTLKKSRDILCAAYNLKVSASERMTPDDAFFEPQARAVVSLERLILETSAFDFRSRHPHKLLIKLSKFAYDMDKDVRITAFEICTDLHRTFACLKVGTSSMAMASLELSCRLHQRECPALMEGRDYKQWNTNRHYIMETLLDLLDLYTSHRTSTLVGTAYTLDSFINIRLALNQESTAASLPRHVSTHWAFPQYTYNVERGTLRCITDPSEGKEEPVYHGKGKERDDASLTTSPATPGSSLFAEKTKYGQKDTTVRFMLDGEKAAEERAVVEEYFREEEEEYEVEVEEEVVVERGKERGYRR